MSQPALVNVFRLLTQSIIKFWILSRTFRLLLCGFQFAQLIVHYLKISRGKFPRLIFSCPVPSGLPHGSHCVPINMNRCGFRTFVAAGEGFEPSHTESESAVLPLHKPAIFVRSCRTNRYYYTGKQEFVKVFLKKIIFAKVKH